MLGMNYSGVRWDFVVQKEQKVDNAQNWEGEEIGSALSATDFPCDFS